MGRKKNSIRLHCSFIFLLASSIFYGQTSYYFSSSSGNDLNSGGQSSPFQSIAKLNNLPLAPGDQVLFKRGDVFTGEIIVSNSGTEGSPIIYHSYGTGELPILSGSNGDNGTPDPLNTIKIIAEEYLEFHDLQIENERFDTAPGIDDDKAFGIYITSFKTLPASNNFEDRELFKYFRFSNLIFNNIYSVNSVETAFNSIRTTGIYFLDAFVNDVIIEDCYFGNIERSGVWLRKYVSDVIIRNNKFIDIGGSGTIISVSKRVLYENNTMRFTGSDSDPRMTGRGSGMWVFASDDVVAQYNISQHARGGGDSSGMHIDYGNTNILYQYNYTEDSAGGFCETLGKNRNVIWRYNISVNDGTEDKSGKNNLLWVSDYAGNNKVKSDKVYIYNNTIYQGKDYKNVIGNTKIILEAKTLNFYNNIIYLESSAQLGEKLYTYAIETANFGKNIMFGGKIKANFKNLDASRYEVNPQFIAPGSRHFSGYKIKSFSPAKGAALSFTEPEFPLAGMGVFSAITSRATKDIYGNAVNLQAATNIGADNGDGTSTTNSVVTFEAESGTIGGGGSEISCENASGGKAVNFQEDGETLTLENINVPTTDLYLITVYYANAAMSSLKIASNGAKTTTILLPPSDAFCFQSGNPTAFSVVQPLHAGTNTIQFEKGILDKIEVVSIPNATLEVLAQTETFSKEKIYLERTMLSAGDPLRLLHYASNERKETRVSIYHINGSLAFKKTFTDTNIKINTAALGKGVKIITAEIEGYVFVKKIIIY
jgi:hypothetical protein